MSAATVAKELWEAWLIRGVVTVLFGIAAVFWPSETTLILIYIFSAFILVSGIVTILNGISDINRTTSWFLTIVLGIFEAGVGVYLIRHPHVTFTSLVLLIGFVLIARGIIEIVSAFLEQDNASSLTLKALAGILAIIVGIIMLFQKQAAGLAFVWVLGLYAIIVGSIQISTAVESKRHLLEKR